MAKKRKKTPGARERPLSSLAVWLGGNGDDCFSIAGFTPLNKCPEIVAAVTRIATLIASMTIQLWENTPNGDVRIRDGLSRKVDISPWRYGTRQTFMQVVLTNMLLHGGGNAVVVPVTREGLLDELIPIPPSRVGFLPDGYGYKILIDNQEVDPAEVLHFVCMPDSEKPWLGDGFRVALRDVAQNLKQASATKQGFMESKWKPSLIVKVDALAEAFSGPEGRKKLLDEYVNTANAGEPWLIPAEQFSVEQVRPLSLSDLAISDSVEMDKRTVASILGVPAFVLGVGKFDPEEWNTFISSTIMPIAKGIEQELTRKLLFSPNRYFKFSSRSLFSYSLETLAKVADDQFVRGIMTGNEVRDWLGMSPMDGLDELVILENYIPLGKLGEQKKLIQNGGDE